MRSPEIDDIDRKILQTLQQDARISNVRLACQVGLSPSPCLRRVRELESQGVIRDHVTLVDPAAIGLGVSVFLQVTLEKQVEKNSSSSRRQSLNGPKLWNAT